MKISQRGIELIHSFEGCRLYAYKCLPSEEYFTIGWGHYGKDVRIGQRITQEQADALFLQDIVKYEDRVKKYDHIYHWNQNQYDALVSFCYNIGSIDQLTADGKRDIKTISEKILLYNKSGGSVIPGLVTRRQKEKALFDAPIAQEQMKIKEDPIKIPSRLLKRRCSGNDVYLLQILLNKLFNKHLDVDGKFGPITEKAVKDIQHLYNIDVDGIYGPITKSVIITYCKRYKIDYLEV